MPSNQGTCSWPPTSSLFTEPLIFPRRLEELWSSSKQTWVRISVTESPAFSLVWTLFSRPVPGQAADGPQGPAGLGTAQPRMQLPAPPSSRPPHPQLGAKLCQGSHASTPTPEWGPCCCSSRQNSSSSGPPSLPTWQKAAPQERGGPCQPGQRLGSSTTTPSSPYRCLVLL